VKSCRIVTVPPGEILNAIPAPNGPPPAVPYRIVLPVRSHLGLDKTLEERQVWFFSHYGMCPGDHRRERRRRSVPNRSTLVTGAQWCGHCKSPTPSLDQNGGRWRLGRVAWRAAGSLLLQLAGSVGARAQGRNVEILHSFNGADGSRPHGLIRVGPEELWGVTDAGGLWGHGSIFRMTRGGAFTPVYSFLGVTSPLALVLGGDGAVYGTTAEVAGVNQPGVHGTLFRVGPSGALTTLVVFDAVESGYRPGPLMATRDGAIYGGTSTGGPNGYGTIFQVDMNGSLTIVHAFTADEPADGLLDPMVETADGALWGTRSMDVFRLTRSGQFTAFPVPQFRLFSYIRGLVPGLDGSLYGTFHAEGFPGYGESMAHISASGAITVASPEFPESYVRIWAQTPDSTLFATNSSVILRVNPDFADAIVAVAPGEVVSLIDGHDGYLYGTSADGGANGLGTVFRVLPTTTHTHPFGDFDGDGRADPAVYRASDGVFYAAGSQGSNIDRFLGGPGVIPVPADYEGGGLSEPAAYRPSDGTWFVDLVGNRQVFRQWGGLGDIPVPADYDGDGKADITVFRPSTGEWFIIQSATQTSVTYTWGGQGDIPVPGDYDGDGKADLAVFRPSTGMWYVWLSATQTGVSARFGNGGDVPIPRDYDGDGKADFAVYRPSTGTWYIAMSSTQFTTSVSYTFGGGADVPVPADYDGDGKADLAVFRPSNGMWYVWQSSTGSGTTYGPFGGLGDVPF
jgi:uncharacterized repeat protein (TIGR03803 family)